MSYNGLFVPLAKPQQVTKSEIKEGLFAYEGTIPNCIGTEAVKFKLVSRQDSIQEGGSYALFGQFTVEPEPFLEVKFVENLHAPTGAAMMVSLGKVIRKREVTNDNGSFTSVSLACKQSNKGDDGFYKTTWVGATISDKIAPYVREKDTEILVLGRPKLRSHAGSMYLDSSLTEVKLLSKTTTDRPSTEPSAARSAATNVGNLPF